MAYSEDQIGEALAVLAANDGNAARTRRGLKAAGWERVPTRRTLRRWQESERRVKETPSQATPREVASGENAHHKKEALADRLEAMADVLVSDLMDPERRTEASYHELVGGLKVATERMQLLRGSATEIQEQRSAGVSFYQQINAAGQSSAAKDQKTGRPTTE